MAELKNKLLFNALMTLTGDPFTDEEMESIIDAVRNQDYANRIVKPIDLTPMFSGYNVTVMIDDNVKEKNVVLWIPQSEQNRLEKVLNEYNLSINSKHN